MYGARTRAHKSARRSHGRVARIGVAAEYRMSEREREREREERTQEKECFCERARESLMWIKEDKKGERMEREPREIQRGCESAAGFPGFVVMTTKPPLPDQTEIRATTDGNVYTNAHVGRERMRGWVGYGRADGERDGMARERNGVPFHPKTTPARARFLQSCRTLQSFRNPRRLAIRRLLHRERRPSDSQSSREMNQHIEYFDPLSAEFVAPLPVILHRIARGKELSRDYIILTISEP
ncbi:hypothetical protein ALC62_06000 [Cyphomyrmex costatus]|uniref:Uncharacterized protein n=1 Tax=Cyphomyrmex costatus TaxID=456900 RepID=A0A195CQX1_9HYME|nr:hypothetical protein ALC62_06000 [Cyphomyrmex costatus]